LGSNQTVGRGRELERLDSALESLAAAGLTCLTVEGEPGIGKTRLLAELQERAERQGHVVLAGSASEFERDLPFAVWVDALDAYVASQAPSFDRDDDADLLAELGGVLPSIRPEGGRPDSALADERYRAHRAIKALLERLAELRPVVLVLDDLHWSDGASIELIAALLRRGVDAPVLVAVGFRPKQAPEGLAVATAVASVARIELRQLTEPEAIELLGDVDARSAAAIYARGGGNPFYLEQLARASEGGRLDAALLEGARDDAPGGAGVPPAVAASLAEELHGLTADARLLLDAAGVAGEPFDPDLAAAIAGVDETAALTVLDDLLELDLVRPTRVPREFTFRHPLVRRWVYESTRGGWRLAAHARAAVALAERGAGPPERAHHVEQSAGRGDEAAIETLLEAGRATTGRAPSAAARWFGAALRLLPAADTVRRGELLVELASVQRALGELDPCRDSLLEAIELLPADDVGRRIELVTRCAAVEHWLGRHTEAHKRLTRAWEDLPDRATPEAAALQVELAADGLHEFDFAQALAVGREALDRARTLSDGPLVAMAASALALGLAVEGRIPDAREHLGLALDAIEKLDDAELAPRVDTLYYLAWAENYLERYDDSLAHAERGIAIVRATGEGRLFLPLLLVKCYPYELQGRLGEAMELCQSAVEGARLSGNPHELFWALFELGWAHYYVGDLDAAVAACEESARVGGQLAGGAMPAAGGGPGWPLAAARFELGELDRGFEVMDELGSDDLEHAIPVERCYYWESLALAELARDRPAAAEAYTRRAEEHAAGLDLEVPAGLALRARAAVLLAGGEASAAAAVAGESAAALKRVGAALQAGFATSLRGRALAAAGDKKAAIAALREAEGVFESCGALRVRDEARRELRKLGARAETRGPASADEAGIAALTKRELGVAELVTDRKTNKEIAADLFLSEKTIESHLRNIFVKLGVSSRVEVARAIERDRGEREQAAAS
jgi:DNA-binding NarL/FixJ family response regulator